MSSDKPTSSPPNTLKKPRDVWPLAAHLAIQVAFAAIFPSKTPPLVSCLAILLGTFVIWGAHTRKDDPIFLDTPSWLVEVRDLLTILTFSVLVVPAIWTSATVWVVWSSIRIYRTVGLIGPVIVLGTTDPFNRVIQEIKACHDCVVCGDTAKHVEPVTQSCFCGAHKPIMLMGGWSLASKFKN